MIPFSFQLRKLKERQITLLDNCYLQKKWACKTTSIYFNRYCITSRRQINNHLFFMKPRFVIDPDNFPSFDAKIAKFLKNFFFRIIYQLSKNF